MGEEAVEIINEMAGSIRDPEGYWKIYQDCWHSIIVSEMDEIEELADIEREEKIEGIKEIDE